MDNTLTPQEHADLTNDLSQAINTTGAIALIYWCDWRGVVWY